MRSFRAASCRPLLNLTAGSGKHLWNGGRAPLKLDGKPSEPKTGHDVVLAPNAKNPYPVYQTLLKSEKYTLQELQKAMALLNQTDLRLKSSGQDATLVLDKAVIEICGARGS